MREKTKIAIIGNGAIGRHTVSFLVQQYIGSPNLVKALGPLEIILNNTTIGKAEGLKLEIENSFGMHPNYPEINFCPDKDDYQPIAGADIVIITAGIQRKPDQDRNAVLDNNAPGAAQIGIKLKEAFKGQAQPLVIGLANPADVLCAIMLQTTGFDPARIVAMTGELDSARFHNNLTAIFPGVPKYDIKTMVIGSHDNNMVPVLSHTAIAGAPLKNLIGTSVTAKQIEDAIAETKKAGTVINTLQGASANIAPAHHALRMALDYLCGYGEQMIACRQIAGFAGVKDDVCLAVPVIFTAKGAEIRYEVQLDSHELHAFQHAAKEMIGLDQRAANLLSTNTNSQIAQAFMMKLGLMRLATRKATVANLEAILPTV